jgi:uncharacterized protein YecT (DUF1311 family)
MTEVSATLAVLLIAVAGNPCNQGTTYDMRTCWSKQSDAASSELTATYAKVAAKFAKSGVSTVAVAASQTAWVTARDKTCAFEYELYLPGTIAPQLGVECDVRMTRARTQRLASLLAKSSRAHEQPVSPAADAALNRLYRDYLKRLTKTQQSSLVGAELAWSAYRDKACAIEGGSCLTELTNERATELKASWIGEAFWLGS